MTKFDFFCPCPLGLEEALNQELKTIFSNRIQNIEKAPLPSPKGGVFWHGTLSEAMIINLHSRIASRVMMKLKREFYQNENDIYHAAKTYPWENWIRFDKTMRVDCRSTKISLRSLNFVTLRIKDAICDRLREKQGARPSIDTINPDIRIFAFLSSKEVTLYIDTSGSSLFKRGWRLEKGEAPMKENLAAGILHLTNWHPGEPLIDPMCGSGTILTEASQIVLNIPPGLSRNFAFEQLLPHSDTEWKKIKQQAKDKMESTIHSSFTKDALAMLQGSDISQKMIEITKNNLRRAGVPLITLKQIDIQAISPSINQFAPGVIFVNPPYGERLTPKGNKAAILSNDRYNQINPIRSSKQILFGENSKNNLFFFKKFGDVLKQKFPGWRAFILTANLDFPKVLGLKESSKIPIFNGPLECRLFRFDLVKGSMRKVKGNL